MAVRPSPIYFYSAIGRFRRFRSRFGQSDADTVGTVERSAQRPAAGQVKKAAAVRAGEQRGVGDRRRLLFAAERRDGQQTAARPVAGQQFGQLFQQQKPRGGNAGRLRRRPCGGGGIVKGRAEEERQGAVQETVDGQETGGGRVVREHHHGDVAADRRDERDHGQATELQADHVPEQRSRPRQLQNVLGQAEQSE